MNNTELNTYSPPLPLRVAFDGGRVCVVDAHELRAPGLGLRFFGLMGCHVSGVGIGAVGQGDLVVVVC
jgi:hypothetical protein